MSKELNDIRKLAGLKLVESVEVEEEQIDEYFTNGEYYAEYDDDSAMWCVFHTDKGAKAYASCSTQEQADAEAKRLNDELDEEVDHTRYGNAEDTTSYELGSFDNKGRASLPNRYVQSRYGDNPLKNAKQIAKEDIDSLEAELERFIAESKAEECDDADEDIIVQAKDQLDEINLDVDEDCDEEDC